MENFDKFSFSLLVIVISVIHGYPSNDKATVDSAFPFNAKADAAALNVAVIVADADKRLIIDVLTGRRMAEREEIAKAYKEDYDRNLVDDLKTVFSGDIRDFVVAMMTSASDYYFAEEFYKAVAGIGTDEKTIIELLCTLGDRRIRTVAEAYERLRNHSLKEDLADDTSGFFKELVIAFSAGNRNEGVDYRRAIGDARLLCSTGDEKSDVDEVVFRVMIETRSYDQLRNIFHEYSKNCSYKIEETIKNKFSGDARELLLSIVKYVGSTEEFFAERLYSSMRGLRTDEGTLTRIIVPRSEIDLGIIDETFVRLYGESLEKYIEANTSGDYKYALVSLVRKLLTFRRIT